VADPLPAVAEAAAAGATADLFADIRATVGVRVVNLVWRHLAILPGALPWAWSAVRPLYVHGIVDEAAVQFREAMIVPRLQSLAGEVAPGVDDVLASYDHSNTVNLFSLGALRCWMRGELAPGGLPREGQRLPVPDVTLPRLASIHDVTPETWSLIVRLNSFGDPDQVIMASMYRQLAHAPRFLQRIESALAAAAADGALDRAIKANQQQARRRSTLLARAIVAPPAPLPQEIERGIGLFLDHAIGPMVTICRAIRLARGA
jgi:hypothetical protein